MDALTQAEVFALIGELNGFIEKWDPRLVTQEREYQAKRTRIIAENNAAQYYPDYTYDHPLFTNGMKQYSDSTVSDFLNP